MLTTLVLTTLGLTTRKSDPRYRLEDTFRDLTSLLNTYTLETRRLSIDLPKEIDARRLFDLVGGADRDLITATLIWDGPESVEDVAEWVTRCNEATFGEFGFHWVIRDQDGIFGDPGQALGAVGVRPRHETPGRVDIGYWLGFEFWGNGIMTEVVGRIVSFVFQDLNCQKMEGDVFVGNDASLRVLERNGFVHEGLVRHGAFKRGRWLDVHLMGILPSDVGNP